MTNGRITGPNGPQSPGGLYDPFQSLQSLTDQFEAALSASIDDPEEFNSRLLDGVLSMPPEERFENAIKVLDEIFADEFGSSEAFIATLPITQNWLERFIDELLERAIIEMAKTAFKRREGGDWLVVLPVLFRFRSIFSMVANNEFEREELEKLFSSVLAVFIRLYTEMEKEQESREGDFELVAADLARADRVISPILGEEFGSTLIDDVSAEEAYEAAKKQGAVICYAYAEISVGRGGELIGISEEEFEVLLDSHDLEPRHGPDSPDGLNSGPNLNDG